MSCLILQLDRMSRILQNPTPSIRTGLQKRLNRNLRVELRHRKFQRGDMR